MGSNPTLSAIAGSIDAELAACVAAGRFEPLAGAYAPGAVLEAHLPGGDVVRTGPEAITAELTSWFGGEPAPVSRPPGLFGPDWQRPGVDGRPVRHTHWLHRDGGGWIERHVVFPGRPLTGEASMGQAGSWLERRDGRLVKHISPAWDWIMRATADTGREAILWRDGPLRRLPDGVVDPVVAVRAEGDGWAVEMEDVTEHLVAAAPLGLPASDARRLVGAAAAVHERFAGRVDDVAGLCALEDRLLLLSPRTAAREDAGVDYIPKQVRRGWQLFPTLVPADVAGAVAEVHADPAPLAAALLDAGTPTLVHGDLNLRNVGLTPDAVVLVDWALAARAPAEVDFAFLLTSWVLTRLGRDELEAAFREASGRRWSERGWELAMIGQLAWEGQFLAVLAVDHPDAGLRSHFLAELAWWSDRVRRALDTV